MVEYSFPESPGRQPLEVGLQVLPAARERGGLVPVEQRREGCAVGERELRAHRPGASSHLFVDQRVRRFHLRPRLFDTERVALALRAQPVADDLLDRKMDVQVARAVAQATLEGTHWIGGVKRAPPRPVPTRSDHADRRRFDHRNPAENPSVPAFMRAGGPRSKRRRAG
jgi:hypothetical protein